MNIMRDELSEPVLSVIIADEPEELDRSTSHSAPPQSGNANRFLRFKAGLTD